MDVSTAPAENLQYPIGRFLKPPEINAGMRESLINALAAAPAELRAAVRGLKDLQLDTPYRPGGWTIRQVVHHLPDSHMNAYVRFKLALTEEEPTVRPYDEALWAELPEARSHPIEVSLRLFDALQERWVACMRGLPEAAFERRYRHPVDGLISLHHQLALYSWHSRHHTAQISGLRRRMGWE